MCGLAFVTRVGEYLRRASRLGGEEPDPLAVRREERIDAVLRARDQRGVKLVQSPRPQLRCAVRAARGRPLPSRLRQAARGCRRIRRECRPKEPCFGTGLKRSFYWIGYSRGTPWSTAEVYPIRIMT